MSFAKQIVVIYLGARQAMPKERQVTKLAKVRRQYYVSCQVQVLVIYLGDMRWKWLPLAVLLPFQKHQQEKVAEADSLITAKRLTKPILFHKALKVTTRLIMYTNCNRGERVEWAWDLRR